MLLCIMHLERGVNSQSTLLIKMQGFLDVTPKQNIHSGQKYHRGQKIKNKQQHNAPVKLLCPHPPPGSTGVRENMRVIKKGGALEKG